MLSVQNLLNVQRTRLGRHGRQVLGVLQVLSGTFEHLRQHVVLHAHLHELFPNDLSELLSPRRQTTKAVMHRRYRSDALLHRSIDREEQVRGVASMDEVGAPSP